MKSLKLYIVLVVLFLMNIKGIQAQESKVKTTQFHVQGVCGDCKVRIENSAYIKGVKNCEWNKNSKILTIIYNPSKVEVIDIHKSIANAGHATDSIPANKGAYEKLPACCKYDDGVHTH